MNFKNILSKKLNKKSLDKEEISFFIKSISANKVPDYQISTMLAAIYINGLSDKELYNLTIAMRDSGEIVDFPWSGYTIDKHSTGGVGDKITLIVSPILSAFGIKTTKMSGRGLGITGGTIDKLNSVGIETNFSIEKANKLLSQFNMFIMEQTTNLVPADGILYKIRDVTSTIDSIPLITSSIMSKKLATKATHIYLDVKVGKGAFFENKNQAKNFVDKAMMIARKNKQKLTCTLTDMNIPLGMCVGNRLEIYESLKFLNGDFFSKSLRDLVFFFVTEILIDKKIVFSEKEAYEKINQMILSKKPLNIFLDYAKELNSENLQDFEKLIFSKFKANIYAPNEGFFSYPNALIIGEIALELKAGRKTKESLIDPYAGIRFCVDNNTLVKKGDLLIEIYSSEKIDEFLIEELTKEILIESTNNKTNKIILGVYSEK